MQSVSDYDTILVEPGTYKENIIWPDKQGIKLKSDAGRDSTVISGDNDGRVITIDRKVERDTLISGFTIRAGFFNASAPVFWAYGGGIHLDQASITITDCKITENRAQGLYESSTAYGGGIFSVFCAPVIHNCEISDNSVYAISEATGGGIWIGLAPGLVRITNCIIHHNDAHNAGDGIYAEQVTWPTTIFIRIPGTALRLLDIRRKSHSLQP